VLRDLERDILAPKSLEFVDLIQEFNYEFTWYNYFLQKRGGVIHSVEPFFHCVHSGIQLVDLQTKGTVTEDFARGFVGIVVNGNFQHFREPASLENHPIFNAVAYIGINKLFLWSLRFSVALIVRVLLIPFLATRRLTQKLRNTPNS
jgi:hypothetical protein